MSVVLTSMIKQVSFFRSTKWTILPWKMLSIDKFINGSEPKIIMFFLPFFFGGGGGKGGEVGGRGGWGGEGGRGGGGGGGFLNSHGSVYLPGTANTSKVIWHQKGKYHSLLQQLFSFS